MKKLSVRLFVMLSKTLLYGISLQVFFLTTLMAYEGTAQEYRSIKETKLGIQLKDATVKEIFRYIENQTAFKFFYDESIIDPGVKISLNKKNMLISDVLLEVSRAANLKFRQINQMINVNQKHQEPGENREVIEVIIQSKNISGKVTSYSDGEGLPGVNVVEKGTTNGTVTNVEGEYKLTVNEGAVLVFSSVGFTTEEITVGSMSVIDVVMTEDIQQLQELVVIGYGTVNKSDVTGSVASIPQERLEMIPNTHIAQTLQGAIPGVQISANSAGASQNDNSILIRGRNSIRASNDPLIVLDGVPYRGQLGDISPYDIKSVEVLKDASAAAIYGSRGANGVILITTKMGEQGKMKVSYDGFYSIQKMTNFPDLMNGEEFYQFKLDREPDSMTESEQEVYDNKAWVDWPDLALRNGSVQQHNISLSGGNEKTNFFISTNLLDVKGLAVNDKFTRITNRINVDTDLVDWLTLGTRTSLAYTDEDGLSPSFSDVTWMNPLTTAYAPDGSLALYPNPDDPFFGNPLQNTLAQNIDKSYQVVSNNFVAVDLPVSGLEYKINTGVRFKYTNYANYYGRDTQIGLEARGDASTNRSEYLNLTLENILSYTREFGRSKIFATGLYSFEKYENSSNRLSASGFPHDILSWYSARQAELITPRYDYSNTNLISQMLRVNYSFDNRYLITLTGRRDGFSGFGAQTKWGTFPSVALGWNIANESFFPFSDKISTLKLRAGWGNNGNQAVGAYETISRLRTNDWVSGPTTQPGYVPSKLGEDNLGWETTTTYNLGIDFGIFSDRIYGDVNFYQSETSDLLLNRSISPVHGIDEVTQNIGRTQNKGIEFAVNSNNISNNRFSWNTSANFALMKNKILSLYGTEDENGQEVDDVGNRWFIGEPIQVIFDHEVIGVWQLDEEAEAAEYGSQPGFVKLRDLDNDGDIDAEDRLILGQRDPNFIWGINNFIEFGNFSLNFFIHGVHGVTKENSMKNDGVWNEVRRNTVKKNWWTPDNPTNDYYANHRDAAIMGAGDANYYENGSFIRFKDITLAYDLPENLLNSISMKRLRFYVTGRNLLTITDFGGMDPELSGQRGIPLQKEYVMGLNVSF